ncbi:hypothetical protein BLOT_004389, partial [Blomia tropicalis]
LAMSWQQLYNGITFYAYSCFSSFEYKCPNLITVIPGFDESIRMLKCGTMPRLCINTLYFILWLKLSCYMIPVNISYLYLFLSLSFSNSADRQWRTFHHLRIVRVRRCLVGAISIHLWGGVVGNDVFIFICHLQTWGH